MHRNSARTFGRGRGPSWPDTAHSALGMRFCLATCGRSVSRAQMRILLREHRTIAIRTYSVPDLEESQGLFTSIERICGSTGSCAAHALTWRSRPCMALGEWIQQWLQIVAEIVTEHPNVVTRLVWPCTRCFVDNVTQSHSTPPYKGAWANATKSATTQSSPTRTTHTRSLHGVKCIRPSALSHSQEGFATRAPSSRARQQSSPASHPL